MAQREYRSVFTCAETGCREAQYLVHDLRADQAAADRRQREKPFKCSRHAKPEQNLRPDNQSTQFVYVVTRKPTGLYWVTEGNVSGSGYSFGPGFNAHADDFPEGTRLIVSAQIEVPAAAEAP